MPDLSVDFGPFSLKNPVMTASGTSGHGDELARYFPLESLGAFVVKGLSVSPKVGNPPPRITETRGGMLNAIGLENPGIETFLSEHLGRLPHDRLPIVANCFGADEEKYVEAVRLLGNEPRITALELNISCPNVKRGGLAFGSSTASVRSLVSACRAVTDKPLFVKLSPVPADNLAHAEAAMEAGAFGLTCFNTYLGTDIDVRTRRFRLSPGRGGLSGPAILPLSLLKLYEVCRALPGVPVLASGGVTTGADALKYILAGAWAVQIGTATLVEPTAPVRILSELHDLATDLGVASLAELRGTVISP